jgi:C-terminal processing protease CtpA/Prc
MAESTNEADLLRQAHVRLCRLCLWSNFEGLGLHLQPSTSPPHIINMIESNSPAAASGLRIWDIILSVNYHDMSQESYERVQKAIKVACNDVIYVDLLVVEKKYYKSLKSQNIDIDFTLATVITAPAKMPIDFAKFPKLIPRIYNLRLGQNDTAFGFNIANGENDVGAYIQTIYPDTPASDAGLRKSDRIIEINDRNVERRSGEYIDKKLRKAKAKGTIKLFVADTHTYEYYMKHNMKFSSTEPQTDRKQKKDDERE